MTKSKEHLRTFHQLTQAQRYQIYALQKTRDSLAEIAKMIGVHKSSINYELKRNRGKAQLIFLPDPDYGARGAGGMIPPKAILVFDVELVNVKNRTAIHFGWL